MSNESVFKLYCVRNLLQFCTFSNLNIYVLSVDMKYSFFMSQKSNYNNLYYYCTSMAIEIQGAFAPPLQCPPSPQHSYLSSAMSNQVSIKSILNLSPEPGLPTGCLPSGLHLTTF